MRRGYTQGNEKLFCYAILLLDDKFQPSKAILLGKRNNCMGYDKITIRGKLEDGN